MGYYYVDIKNSENYKGYDLFSYNCVQVSMEILFQGRFDSQSIKYRDEMIKISGYFYPNAVFNKLYYFT